MFPCFAVLHITIASSLPPPRWFPACLSRYLAASQSKVTLCLEAGTKMLFSGYVDTSDAAICCGQAVAHALYKG